MTTTTLSLTPDSLARTTAAALSGAAVFHDFIRPDLDAVEARLDAASSKDSNPLAVIAVFLFTLLMVTREGTRPLLVEVQALVDSSPLSNPRRVAVGLEQNRLAMLLAVLHRHGGVGVGDQDVFVNVVGGIRLQETAADLPVLLAVLSSLRDKPLADKTIAFGEVGLSGEIRPVPNGEERLREAATHGFKRAIVPKANAPKSGSYKGLEIIAVERLVDALAAVD